MRERVFEATVTRWCAAPREAILAWEQDPHAAASVDSRVRVKDVVSTPEGVGTRWTTTMTVGGLLRMRMQTMLMALDPVIVEGRTGRVVGKSTTSVSADPDQEGRYCVVFTHESVMSLPPVSYAYYGRRRGALLRKLSRVLGDYADKTVAGIEARARSTMAGTGQA